MPELTTEARQIIQNLAHAHGVSAGAVEVLLRALAAGNGYQAQFSHPELGGMGQWSQGGMIMIGDMFNQGLKHKVSSLCEDLAGVIRNQRVFAPAPAQSQMQSQSHGHSQQQGSGSQGQGRGSSLFVQGSGFGASGFGSWWPAELGSPASSGAQNDMSYAWFPATRRLAIRLGGDIRIYDTGDHNIGGVSQQQSGDRSLTFTSQYGLVRVADLPLVSPATEKPVEPVAAPPTPVAPPDVLSPPSAAPSVAADDVFSLIEKLAALREKNILTDEEFAAKKTELLSRL
jgi:hypothetical protein